ncbi:MAG: dihydroorotate dehydrogenase [Oscillospiraceae bacterium]|nr:dihydroorotate dehydrogenase [Oscillospiraceae bacterium]
MNCSKQTSYNSILTTTIAGVELKNPVIPASGCFGFGYEMSRFYDLNLLGAIAIKGTTSQPRYGNELPRIAECPSGMLNAIGLQNPGVKAVIREELPKLRDCYTGPVIANISGFSVDEYVEVASYFNQTDVAILEVNISCPNAKDGGMVFGTTAEAAAEVTRAVKEVAEKPVFVKLTPNVTDIVSIAKSCENEGADGLTLINTLLGMRIDPRSGKPIVSIGAAGLSGPAIKPVAVRIVYQVATAVNIPIIGVGGICCCDDVIEMISAGATAVQIGSANLINPYVAKEIIELLPAKLVEYGIDSINECIGRSFR